MAKDQRSQEPAQTPGARLTESMPVPAPIFVTKRCIIRPYHLSDAPALARAADNPRLSLHLHRGFPSPYKLSDAEWWIRHTHDQKPLQNFAIVTLDGKAEGTFAGSIGLHDFLPDVQNQSREIGYWLSEEHWGKGLMTEVVAAFSRWAFETVPSLHRLEIGAHADNQASCRVAVKAGYTFEGTKREAGWKAEKGYFGLTMHGLLRDECLGKVTA
jgi:[ribosomal protein S5]-alanine N-acetyltransferase